MYKRSAGLIEKESAVQQQQQQFSSKRGGHKASTFGNLSICQTVGNLDQLFDNKPLSLEKLERFGSLYAKQDAKQLESFISTF